MQEFFFDPCELPAAVVSLRGEVRAFLDDWLRNATPIQRARSWGGFDREFSNLVGARGWIGMTWPNKYGGAGRSGLERYVVLEEMLAAGAPVAAHWFGDRQSGPQLLRFGTERQRQEILPRIVRGELVFAVGLSEPDAGSDLAAIRTRATPVRGGWSVNGSKVWTTNAHRADYMIALLRTELPTENRHAGLSQFLIDMTWPGINVRPIEDLTGEVHFNEVFFDNLFLPEDSLIGQLGEGWHQAMAELAYERSGPERFMSSIQVLFLMIRELSGNATEEEIIEIGRLVSELSTLRRMSISVAGMLDSGRNPSIEAAIVKDLGARFEQLLPEVAQRLLEIVPSVDAQNDLQKVLAHIIAMAPAYSLRGGAREILRGIVAQRLELR
jgi:alkylation response protein AidB-like acyl-CoA dehydrogenase